MHRPPVMRPAAARPRPLPTDHLAIVLFIGALCAPLLAWGVNGIPANRRMLEERMSTQLPAPPTGLVELSNYPTQFEGWFDDSLGLRVEFLSLRSRLYLGLLGTSPTPAAYLGRDAWVLLSGGHEFDSHRGAAPFSAVELEAWAGAIESRRRWCNARGIQYVFALAPCKTNVYPERHPLSAETLGPTRFDQLAQRLAGDSGFLDLRPAVLRAKSEDRANDHAYFPYGSHWTDRGSTAGATALFERIRGLPGLSAWRGITDEELIWDPAGCEGDSWAGRLYLQGVLKQNERLLSGVRGRPPEELVSESEQNRKRVTEIADPTLPSVVYFHDSFGVSMEPFFTHRASRCVCLWHAFEPRIIEAEQPKLVVELFVEYVLDRAPIENVPEQAALTEQRFADAKETVFKLDAERDASEIGQRGGVEVERDGSALRLHWTRPVALAQLPAAILPAAKHVIVRLDFALEAPCEMSFFYLSRDNDQYRRQQSLTKALTAGENRVYLDLGQPGLRGPVVFLSPTTSDLILRDCEARAVR